MKRFAFAVVGVTLLCVWLTADDAPVRAAVTAPQAPEASPASLEELNFVVQDYCLVCHNDTALTGGLTLEGFDVARAVENAEIAEKMIRKLRAGMMPPPYAPHPENEQVDALVGLLERRIDEAYEKNPNTGRRPFQRLNRAEYERSVHDLVGIDVDVTAFLPPDTISHSFDNIADVQTMSATLLEGYMRAADQISRLAVGDPDTSPTEATYKLARTASQMQHVEGAPMGTRGGISVVHNFPDDGEYIFKVQLHGTPTGLLFGLTNEEEKIEISVNGERVALLGIDPLMTESDKNGLILQTDPIAVRAGPHRIAAAFIQRFVGPIDDLMAPIDHTLADTTVGEAFGMTTLPHLRFFSINGPHHVTGVSDTPSRRRIFTCRPVSAEDEIPCASEIVTQLATKAYRRPVSESDVEGLMSFYQAGRDEGDFETGIRKALQAILASPHFVFRLERVRAEAAPGENTLISDLELATRLAFFLWASSPDEELVAIASNGALRDPGVIEEQIRRMLRDPRSKSLATRFFAQWLRLQDLEKIHPDALLYPYYDQTLAEAMRRESELFFEYMLREDRSLLDLLTADYTFVNERLAEHYEIPNVTGADFQYVRLDDDTRRGILGHGSILTLTSIADRTSPVQRGKWILEVLLGTPPPPPPPNIPELEATKEVEGGERLTVRELLAKHRADPACKSCHDVIDPLGLALENFDVTGRWRIKDNGAPVDASGELYDGTTLHGPAGLRQALSRYSDTIISSFTESLMTYGLGRRVEYYDMPAIRQIVRAAAERENRLSSFIEGVAKSPAFQMRTVEPIVSTEEP
ncbi:MAG TPA: DUF1592 domain-containing protein [Vicinamibacteria bacterium]|nr:DUF1592 domain-containing protein [Vicinamibacteria bacterium]